jgi:hypothetical protein
MGTVVLNGAGSGSTTLTPTDAVTVTVTLPSATGTLITSGGAGTDGTSLVLISTASASASAAIDFTSGITSTYNEYLVTLTNIVPASDDTQLLFRVSEDSGATFKAGATDYTYAYSSEQEAGTDASGGSASATSIRIGVSMSSTASKGGWSGELRFFAPAGTTQNKLVTFSGCWPRTSTPDFRSINGAGRFVLDTNAINAIRFIAAAGNLTSGTFSLYGVKKS